MLDVVGAEGGDEEVGVIVALVVRCQCSAAAQVTPKVSGSTYILVTKLESL